MTYKKTDTVEVAAAKAGRATGYRLAADPEPLREKTPRGRRRPLADIFEKDVVPILETSHPSGRRVRGADAPPSRSGPGGGGARWSGGSAPGAHGAEKDVIFRQKHEPACPTSPAWAHSA